MLIPSLQLLLGILILVVGGEATVQGSLTLAQRLRLSPALAGVAIVGFGTSAPELFLSLQAAWKGSAGLASGNIIGSNIANVWLIGGLIVLFSHLSKKQQAKQPAPLHAIAAGVALLTLAAFAPLGNIPSTWGAALLIPFAIYTYLAIKEATQTHTKPSTVGKTPSLKHGILLALGGLVLMLVGSEEVVAGGQTLARMLGVPETIIGLSILALGTSLPEVVATLVAVRRKALALATGGIFGSTIFNSWLILPLCAIILPLDVKESLPDLILAPIAFLLFMLGIKSHKRWRLSLGLACILCYILYWGFLATRV